MFKKIKIVAVLLSAFALGLFYIAEDISSSAENNLMSSVVRSIANLDFSLISDGANPFASSNIQDAEKISDLENKAFEFDLKEIDKIHMPMSVDAEKTAEKTAQFIGFMNAVEPLLLDRSKSISAETYKSLSVLTEKLLALGYLTFYEYQTISLRLLESQYSGAELEQKQNELNSSVAHFNRKLMSEGLPMNNPKFKEYKQAEEQILQEASKMTTFPDGMSIDEYVSKKIKSLKKDF